MPAEEPPVAGAPSAAGAPRRKKKKRPAGSKWLNRLLALGCLASLSPLVFEIYQSRRTAPLAKPHKNDEWVRVIDAAPPDEALNSGAGAAGVRKRFRHHPRHGRSSVRVGGDGTAVDADEGTDGEEQLEHAGSLEERLRARAANASLPLHDVASRVNAAAAAAPGTHASIAAEAGAPPRSIMAAASTPSADNATATPVHRGEGSDEDDLRHYFRQVDRATAGSARAGPAGAAGLAGTPLGRLNRTAPSRLWRTIPGGVHDIIEGVGGNQSVFSVDGIPHPALLNGSYLVDRVGVLDQATLNYANRNLTWVDRLTPFRVLLLVLRRQPKEWASRHLYAQQLLRHWYGGSRMLERTTLIVMSLDGAVEIVVGHQCKLVLSDGVARHFSIKAMELLSPVLRSETADDSPPSEAVRQKFIDTTQKLVYYVSFTVRSRTQATAMSMRSMSMFMMMFMMMTIVATKQQQARRYAELYALDPYGRHQYGASPFMMAHRGLHVGARRSAFEDESFWDDFETGRSGRMQQSSDRAHADAFFRLQVRTRLATRPASRPPPPTHPLAHTPPVPRATGPCRSCRC